MKPKHACRNARSPRPRHPGPIAAPGRAGRFGRLFAGLSAGLFATLLATAAPAQTVHGPALPGADLDPATLSDAELLDLLARIEARRRPFPDRVATLGIPTGFGAPRGLAFASAALTDRRDRGRAGDWDGSLAIGIGLGDATRWIGITPVIEITSVTPNHFGSSGKLGVKLSRRFALGGTWMGSASLDLHNLLTWGDSTALDPEAGVSVSAIRPADAAFGFPLLLSAGYGSGVSRIGADPGGFAGVGIGLTESFGVNLGWYGDEAIAGLSVWPGRRKNLLISVGMGDITDHVSGRRLLLTMSIARSLGRRQ